MRARCLQVLPDSDRVEAALTEASRERAIVDASGTCTMGQLVDLCEPLRWASRAPAPPLLSLCLVSRCARTLALEAFGDAATSPDFATSLGELLAHLKAQTATPRDLREAASGLGESLERRAAAIADVWEHCDRSLAEAGLVDRADTLSLAAARLRAEGLPPRLLRYAELEVRGVHDLFPARLAFLEALADACHRAQLGFTLHYPYSGQPRVDLFLAPALRSIEARWQALDAQALSEVSEAPLSWLVAEAFAPEPSARPAPELAIFTAATPRDELEQLARRIRRLAATGTPLEQIAVAFRDLGAESEGLIEALEAFGVPVRARRGVPLAASPLGRLALSLLELPDQAFPAGEVAALLQSRYVRPLSAGCPPALAMFAEAGARDDELGAVDGRGAYAVRLAALEQRRSQGPSRAAVRLVAERTKRLVGVLSAVPPSGTALSLLDAWERALHELGVLESIRQLEPADTGGLLGREVNRALARDHAAAEALRGLASSLRAALRASGLGEVVLERAELSRWLRTAASTVNLATRGPRTGAVTLLDVRELAGRRFSHLFLGGMLDGRFPGRPAPAPLLSDEERVRLSVRSRVPLFRVGVRDGEDELPVRAAEDRLLLHVALGAADRVTLSRARADASGRELLASPFLEALGRVAEGVAPEDVHRSPLPTLDEAVSEGELRARAALELLCPEEARQTARDPRAAALETVLAAEPWLADARVSSSAEVERLRFFTDPGRAPTEYSGAIVAADLLERLKARLDFPRDRPLSAAELSGWARCGFHGLLSYVARLRVPSERGEELDRRDRGTFWHEVLRVLVPRLQGHLLPLAQSELDALSGELDAAVKEAAQGLERRGPVGHPALWALGQDRARVAVQRFLRAGAAVPFDIQPTAVEQRFGAEGMPEVVLPAAFEGELDVHVMGKIDRLDVSDTQVGVVDYKSSSAGLPAARLRELLATDFQLPLYALAARAAYPGRTVDAAWVGLRARDLRRLSDVVPGKNLEGLIATDAATRQTLDASGNLANAVHAVLAARRSGDFGPRPHDCGFCEFRAVCRISTRQLRGEDA